MTHSYHVQSTGDWKVETVVRRLILNNCIVSVDCVCGKVKSIRWSGQQVQILSNHSLVSCLQHYN